MPKKSKNKKFEDEGLEDELAKGRGDAPARSEKKSKEKKDKKSKKEQKERRERIAKKEAEAMMAGGGGGGGETKAADVDGATEKEKKKKEQQLAKALAKKEKGEKLSNKEKRLLQQLEESKAREEEERKAAEDDLANFTLSLAGGGGEAEPGENVKDVKVENFSINADKKQLFVNATLSVSHGRRYGLIGPNGQGKSTLLKFMGARRLPIPAGIDVLYVEQEVVADDTPAVESVLRADTRRWNLLEEESDITAKLEADERAREERGMGAEAEAGEDESEEERKLTAEEKEAGMMNGVERANLLERLSEVYEDLTTMGAEKAEAKARKILAGLGFTPEMQERPTKHFSGGWRMRISLARALFIEPDLLLLDEPTNHLDLNAVIWLDNYLQGWKKTLLVVSHDQDFLTNVVTDIIHLENKKLNYYSGDYDSFKKMHAQKFEKLVKEYKLQQKKLKEMKESGKSKKQAVKELQKPGGKKKDTVLPGGEELKEGELIERPKEYTVEFDFPEVEKLSPPVIEVMDVSFHYTGGPWLFRDVSFGIDCDSRVAIVGPNGVGKSTMLNLVMGYLHETEGEIRRNRFLRVGHYNQHFVDQLPMDRTPVEYLNHVNDSCKYQEARKLLGRFGLEGHAHTIPIRDLSGGQKARVVFAALTLQDPHILIFDEPTNHLDIESIDALCEAIREFTGGVVVVSHDARLILETDCKMWVCDKQNVLPFDGDFHDYRDHLLEELEKAEAELEKLAEKKAQQIAADRAKRVEAWGVKTSAAASKAATAALKEEKKKKKAAASLFGGKKKKSSKK